MAKVAIMRTLMGLVATAMLLDLVAAVDYTVGAPNGGWDQSTDLQSWATSQTFSVGDNIVFQYSSTHDVLEVSESDYNSCATGSPISTSRSSPTRIALTTAGSRYFICGISNHCSQGMKVQIDAAAASSPAPPQGTTPSAPSPPTDGPTGNSPPPPVTGETVDPPSSAITLKMAAGSILGFGFLVMMLLSL
ncbi:uclacyanin 1-like [Cynara cardunculus var. scolymus]|uniref:Cupredoxin n=1 Tax=Cynara cardunculus var. scolymus TaxID=59895 RepID=A0A118K2C9_CYNCS|nr:uclacyanin 1-like [Cynara cardunculus var. scolymus]KVI04170.1 Cupredoxin [Cynara cardunculus var. scolymus]